MDFNQLVKILEDGISPFVGRTQDKSAIQGPSGGTTTGMIGQTVKIIFKKKKSKRLKKD